MGKLECVLLIDDDEATNYVNRAIIEKLDITTQIKDVTAGAEALKFIKSLYIRGKKVPELLIVDINMPVMNGFEFINAFKAMNYIDQDHVVIVMLSALEENIDIEIFKDHNVVSFLNKPLNGEEILKIVKENFSHGFF